MLFLGNHKIVDQIMDCQKSEIYLNFKEGREYSLGEFMKIIDENLKEKLNNYHISAARVRTLLRGISPRKIYLTQYFAKN